MLKINQTIEIAPFPEMPKYFKQAIVVDIGEEVTVEYMFGIEPQRFSFYYQGYEKDKQVRV